MPARLTVIRGRDIDQVYRIEDAQTAVLGRSVMCDIRVSDSQASRTHCRIQRIDGQWTITDAGSRNGTFVNKQHITPLRPPLTGSPRRKPGLLDRLRGRRSGE